MDFIFGKVFITALRRFSKPITILETQLLIILNGGSFKRNTND